MKKIITFGVCVFILFGNCIAQKEITLAEVIMMAGEYNLSSENAKNDLEIAHSRRAFYKAELKPNFGMDLLLPNFLNTSTQVTQPDGSISFQQITQNNSSISLFGSQNIASTGGQVFVQSDLQRFDNFSSDSKQYNGVPIRVGFVQPFFGFNRLKWDRKILPLAEKEASLNYNIALEDAKWRATNLYFDVLLAQVNKDIAQINKGVNEKLVEITKERLELGKTSRDEFLQLEIGLKSAVLSENQANNQVIQNLNSLFTFLGKDQKEENLKCAIPDLMEIKMLDENSLIAAALKNRPEVIRYEKELLQGEQNIAQVKSQYGIEASLYAGVGFARGADNIDDIYANPFDEQQVRFNVSMPLVDWGKKKEAVKIAQLQQANTNARINQETLELENRVRTTLRQFIQSQSDIQLLNEIRQVAEERFNISNQRYTLGNISITDLTLAQREKDQTLREYIQSLQSYWSNYYALRTLTGENI